jgi:hypothetical protein
MPQDTWASAAVHPFTRREPGPPVNGGQTRRGQGYRRNRTPNTLPSGYKRHLQHETAGLRSLDAMGGSTPARSKQPPWLRIVLSKDLGFR